MEVTIQRYYSEGRLVADKRGGLVSYANLSILEAQINTLQKLNNGASEEVRSSRGRISELEAKVTALETENGRLKAPVSDEERASIFGAHMLPDNSPVSWVAQGFANAIISARAQQPSPAQDKEQP